jgi:hypothetical protein
MQIDERAWLRPELPNNFSFLGPTIPAVMRLSNIGKTAATRVTGSVVATTFDKGERPNLDSYIGRHGHNKIYAGAVYPSDKLPDINLEIVKYSDRANEQPTPVVPDADFVKRFNGKQVYILVFGKVDYCDVFGVKHWLRFCNGSGEALDVDSIKECINYNRPDNNDTPDGSCY